VEHLTNQPSTTGPAEWFTGDVSIDAVSPGVNVVHFTPGARTAWHCHSEGQTLYVTDGHGRVQSRGEAIVEIRPGDIVRTPAAEWHWHGAHPDHAMSHISVTYDGQPTWGEHVSDADYLGRSTRGQTE
jgi:quercetin dioxygenase-like cupin family protein